MVAAARRVRALGGEGSGNFGHAGRPGEVGGSGEGGTIGEEHQAKQSEVDALDAAMTEQATKNSIAQSKVTGLSEHEMRANNKAQVVADLSERLAPIEAQQAIIESGSGQTWAEKNGIDSQTFVQKQLDWWAESSGDHSPPSINMQHAVEQEFNLKDAATDHFEPQLNREAVVLPRDRAYVRAEYENTQAFFKANGITHVSLFRGHLGETTDGPQVVRMQPASSWTTSLETASAFGGEAKSFIMTTRVPVERVLSTSITGRGCLHESEVILLGGKLPVQAFTTKWASNLAIRKSLR